MAIRITWNNARRIVAGLALLAASAANAGTAIQSIHTPHSTGMGSPFWVVPKNKAPADPTVVYLSTDMGATWDVSVPLPTTSAEPPSIVAEGIVAALNEGKFHLFPDAMAQQVWGAYQSFAENVVEADLMEG